MDPIHITENLAEPTNYLMPDPLVLPIKKSQPEVSAAAFFTLPIENTCTLDRAEGACVCVIRRNSTLTLYNNADMHDIHSDNALYEGWRSAVILL